MSFIGPNKPIKVKNGENVNVSKIVRINFINHFVPEYFMFGDIRTYEAGRTYEQFIKEPIVHDGKVEIGEGIHSFLPRKVRLIPYSYTGHGAYIVPDGKYYGSIDYDMYGVQAIGNGFKQLRNFTFNRLIDWDITKHYHLCLLIGHIPPGGIYYTNQWGEVVSDTLTVDLIIPFYWGIQDKTSFKR